MTTGAAKPSSPKAWLAEQVTTGRLDRVRADMRAAGQRINDALGNVKAANKIAKDSPSLAIAGFHDATRKAITAHMIANGYRPTSAPGAHRIVVEYARVVLRTDFEPDDVVAIDNLRRDRADAEYGDFAHPLLEPLRVKTAGELALKVVQTVAALLAK